MTQEVPQVPLFMREGALLSESYPAGVPCHPRPVLHGHFCCPSAPRGDRTNQRRCHGLSPMHAITKPRRQQGRKWTIAVQMGKEITANTGQGDDEHKSMTFK